MGPPEKDITSGSEIVAVAAEGGLVRQHFAGLFEAAGIRNESLSDFLGAQELGIRGFPTLFAGYEEKGCGHYRPLADLLRSLERRLDAGAPLSAPSSGDSK